MLKIKIMKKALYSPRTRAMILTIDIYWHTYELTHCNSIKWIIPATTYSKNYYCSIWQRRKLRLRVQLCSSLSILWHCLSSGLEWKLTFSSPVAIAELKGRGTRDQIANIRWIMERAREFQKNIYFCFIDYAKAFDCVDHDKPENSERDGNTRPPGLPLEKPICRSGSNS